GSEHRVEVALMERELMTEEEQVDPPGGGPADGGVQVRRVEALRCCEVRDREYQVEDGPLHGRPVRAGLSATPCTWIRSGCLIAHASRCVRSPTRAPEAPGARGARARGGFPRRDGALVVPLRRPATVGYVSRTSCRGPSDRWHSSSSAWRRSS